MWSAILAGILALVGMALGLLFIVGIVAGAYVLVVVIRLIGELGL